MVRAALLEEMDQLLDERVRLKAILTDRLQWGLEDDETRSRLSNVEWLIRRLRTRLRELETEDLKGGAA